MKQLRPTQELLMAHINRKHISVINLAINSNIPYIALGDILEKDIEISEENAKKLGKALHIDWKQLYAYDRAYRKSKRTY